MKKELIKNWEFNIVLISSAIMLLLILLEFAEVISINSYPITNSIVAGLAGSFISTIIVLYFERKHNRTSLKNTFLKYDGIYNRIDIGQDNTPEIELNLQKTDNIGLSINMSYKGGHEFMVNIEYWKSKDCKAIAFIEFNNHDKTTARGNYRYTQGEYKGHYGNLELSWDENQNEMIVFYQHKYPRIAEFDPDRNRGWEVWKKL
jgi:hypothetical protein